MINAVKSSALECEELVLVVTDPLPVAQSLEKRSSFSSNCPSLLEGAPSPVNPANCSAC